MTGANDLPRGERLDTVTYRLVDETGMIRGSGLRTEAAAQALAERLLEDPGAPVFTIERVSYVSFTHHETVRQVAGA